MNCQFCIYKNYIALFSWFIIKYTSIFFFVLENILMKLLTNFYDLILLYGVCLTTMFHHCLLLFLCHFFHTFLCLYQLYSSRVSALFISSFISLSFLKTLFTETNSLWKICELIKALELRTSIVSNLVFPNRFILSFFFFVFLMISFILLNSCSDCKHFYSYCRTCKTNANRNRNWWRKRSKHNQ